MFANHQPLVSAYARQNEENFARVLKFVVLSIRTRLMNLPADMQALIDVEQGGNPESLGGVLYGFKMGAIMQIDSEKAMLYDLAESIAYHAESETILSENLLDLFTGIYGLGLAKAGFCAQLIYGTSACLDSHNLARFDISPGIVDSSNFKKVKTLSTKRKWIERYCRIVKQLGGTQTLWDSWCDFVFNNPDETGRKMNRNAPLYESPYHVSALHCLAIGLDVSTKPQEESLSCKRAA